MKTYILLILTLVFTTSSCGSPQKGSEILSYKNLVDTNAENEDPLLINIQDKIDSAFNNSFMNKDTKKLDEILVQLKKIDNPISKYWQAYTNYYKSIYYISNNKKDLSEELIEEAIELLENTPKSSESYALLGTLLNFSIQFKNPMLVSLVSKKATENFNLALVSEPKNIRAYLGLGSLDYYTPEKYGGKKETINYMVKALKQPDQPIKNPILPSWGRNSVYEILIKYNIEKGDIEKAKEYYREAIKIFPNDYQITSLSKKLI